MRHGNIFPTDRSLPSMRARFNGHALKGQKFIAQGKRSDTLGKPPHPITLRPARAKVNITHSVSVLCTYRAQTTQHIIPRAPLRLPLGYELLPLGACPLKRALIERFSACEKSVSICRADGAICVIDKQSAWHLCLSERSVGE